MQTFKYNLSLTHHGTMAIPFHTNLKTLKVNCDKYHRKYIMSCSNALCNSFLIGSNVRFDAYANSASTTRPMVIGKSCLSSDAIIFGSNTDYSLRFH